MAVNVDKDSSSGSEVVGVSGDRGPGVVGLDDDFCPSLEDAADAGRDATKFPGSKEDNSHINWFGGSYSGADMKVVVHLYKKTENNEATARVERDTKVAERIRDACGALVGGGISTFAVTLDPTWSQDIKKSGFLSSAGISDSNDEIDQEAGRFVLRNIYAGANWNTFLGLAKVRQKASQIYEGYKVLALSMADRLKAIKEIQDKGQQTAVLASLQTLSVQSHREKFAVRALGHSYVKGYTRGPRTIAGSMIFTVFNEHVLAGLTRSLGSQGAEGEKDSFMKTLLPDQLPPLDLTIAFANEYGSISQLRLFGVEFINDGATYSIEDLMTENIINFVARDADPMTSHGNIKLHRSQRTGLANEFVVQDKSGSQLLFGDEHYRQYIDRLGFRRRLVNR